MAVVRARPQRLRKICWVAAAFAIIGCSALAAAMSGATGGGGSYRAGDRTALIGVGILLAVGIVMLARPRVEADEHHVCVRNIVGSYDLRWDLVRAVRFPKGSLWASLELADDERISVMAVQVIDQEYAVEAMTGLRNLLAQSRLGGEQPQSPLGGEEPSESG